MSESRRSLYVPFDDQRDFRNELYYGNWGMKNENILNVGILFLDELSAYYPKEDDIVLPSGYVPVANSGVFLLEQVAVSSCSDEWVTSRDFAVAYPSAGN